MKRLLTTTAIAVLLSRPVFCSEKQPVGKTEDTGGESILSLADIKAAGAAKSSFRTLQPQAIGSETPEPNLVAYRKQIEPILSKTCLPCHGPDAQEGNIRVDRLDPDLLHGADVDWWLEIMAVVSNGEMPPADEVALHDIDRSKIVDWLSAEVQIASQVRRADKGHSSFRRMSRYEYNYALQDLLGLPFDFAEDLPPETASEDGFTNSSEVLQMSSMQFGYYRELGRTALNKATVRGNRPDPIFWSVPMGDAFHQGRKKHLADLEKRKRNLPTDPEKRERTLKNLDAQTNLNKNATHYLDATTGDGFKPSWNYNGARYAWSAIAAQVDDPVVSPHVVVIPPKQKHIIELGNTIPDSGTLRVRVRASCLADSQGRVPSLSLNFGWQASNNSSASERLSRHDLMIDASPDSPQFYQWEIPLSEIKVRNPMRKTAKMGETPNPSEYLQFHNTAISGPSVQIDYVEITAPVYEQWPPESHSRIFVDSPNKLDESTYAREVLANFMAKAWRRNVTNSEIDQKMKLFAVLRPECDDFQEAMIEVLATVLASPKFLYVACAIPVSEVSTGKPSDTAVSQLTEFELASRLSFFLWCSSPDEELLALAAKGQLSNVEVLVGQTKRMLADERSRRFSEQFVRHWLGMQLLDFLNVDKKAFPQFDSVLKESMQEEPVAFFHEILQNDRSIIDFIHADYVMTNERLARHYGLADVYGNQFQKVSVSEGELRGGLLTQAGLLAMNSDGKDSHPLKRGIWMLERMLNDPPPPPPPAVPEIDLADPEIAKLTLKERIEDHRNQPACMSCHAKIDPWGIAFENFDAVGSWRTEVNGKAVDASSVMFNKQKLDGMDGLKRFLLANRQDQFARAVTHRLVTFALGRPLTFGDRSSVDQITADLRKHGDGLATLISLIVSSEMFRSK